jgi:hypothetical protein
MMPALVGVLLSLSGTPSLAVPAGKDSQMNWVGKWQNQYGSILEITEEAHHRILGKFRTALPDSGFSGQEIEVVGVHYGDCIGLTAGGLSSSLPRTD